MSGSASFPCRRLGRRPSSRPTLSDVGTPDVVPFDGDLDGSSRERCFDACVAATGPHVHVDLAATAFMDCGGYSALTSARQVIEGRGGRLTWRGAAGEPARLLTLIRMTLHPTRRQPIQCHARRGDPSTRR